MGTWTHLDLEDAVALQGTLDTFALADVLRLLAATKKSGRLEISGPRGTGSIWVAGGDVTAVVADHAPLAVDLVEATFELLRFEHGSFSFDAEAASNGDQASDVEPLLESAEALLAEWREIEATVPSLASWVTMRPELEHDTVSVDRAAWVNLVAVGSGATVAELGDRLGLGELPVSRAVRDLVSLGLVDVEERAPEPVGERAVEPDRAVTAPDVADSGAVETGDRALDDPAEPAEAVDAASTETEAADTAPAGSIPGPKARRARPKQLRVSDASQPEVFVPLDLSALQQQRSYDSEEPSESEDDLTAAFPGLAAPVPAAAVDDTSDETAHDEEPDDATSDDAAGVDAPDGVSSAESDEAEGDEHLNRGLLLKFLSSVKS